MAKSYVLTPSDTTDVVVHQPPPRWVERLVGDPDTRPLLVVNQHQVELDPTWFVVFNQLVRRDNLSFATVTGVAPYVGKLGAERMLPATAVLVHESFALTNHHVVEAIGRSNVVGLTISFGFDIGTAEESTAEIDQVVYPEEGNEPEADVALLKLKDPLPAIGLPTLADEDPEPSGLAWVAAVGYPSRVDPVDNDNNHQVAEKMLNYRGAGGRQRVAPGRIVATGVTVGGANYVAHDCSTLQGSSGSPLVDLATGHIVALHARGDDESVPRRNLAVPITAIRPIIAPFITPYSGSN